MKGRVQALPFKIYPSVLLSRVIFFIAFFFLDTFIQIGFVLSIHVHFNISCHTLEEKESGVFCPLPSLSAPPLLSPCSNSWMGFLLYMSYWHSSSSSSSRLPPTSISLIFIFLLSLSPTASVYLPGKPYRSPVTVIMSPTVSHCGHRSNECVCVWMTVNLVVFTLVCICHIFVGQCICVYMLRASACRFFTHNYAVQTHKRFRQLCSLSPCANLSA